MTTYKKLLYGVTGSTQGADAPLVRATHVLYLVYTAAMGEVFVWRVMYDAWMCFEGRTSDLHVFQL